MQEPDIKDAILTRRFELRDGGTVTVHVWAPVEITPDCEHACDYRIIGLGSDRLRTKRGVDGVQAMWLTLQAISVELYDSDAYRNGGLTWLGGRDLGLPALDESEP